MPANRRVKACSKDVPAEARRSFQHHVWETKGEWPGGLEKSACCYRWTR